jgi:hypothetical protein
MGVFMATDPIFLNLFPIDKLKFEMGDQSWSAEMAQTPIEGKPNDGDALRFKVSFTPNGNIRAKRSLTLWLSEIGLRSDQDGSYKRNVLSSIRYWLDGDELDGEIRNFG